MTVKDVIQLVRGLTGDVVKKKMSINILLSFLNEALDKICSELYLYAIVGTQDTVSGTQIYPLPTGLVKIISVKIDGSDRNDYILEGTNITFADPIVDSGINNIEISYYDIPQYVKADYEGEPSTEIAIPVVFLGLVEDYMLYRIYLNENDDRGNIKLRSFIDGLAKGRGIVERRSAQDTRFWL